MNHFIVFVTSLVDSKKMYNSLEYLICLVKLFRYDDYNWLVHASNN